MEDKKEFKLQTFELGFKYGYRSDNTVDRYEGLVRFLMMRGSLSLLNSMMTCHLKY